jgi:hypothetical protein
LELVDREVDPTSGRLLDAAVERIGNQLEAVRSEGFAVRQVNLISKIRDGVETIGGRLMGVGPRRAVYVELPDGTPVVAYPAVGVPTSTVMYDAAVDADGRSAAVVYDHIGLHPEWLDHLQWLGEHIASVRWVRATEAAWQFADWQA